MIYEFFISPTEGYLWIDTDSIDRNHHINIWQGPTPGHLGSAVMWRVQRTNVGGWVGQANPSWEYLYTQLMPAWTGSQNIGQLIAADPDRRPELESWARIIFDITMRLFPFCEMCEVWACAIPNNPDEHRPCANCEEPSSPRTRRTVSVYSVEDCNQLVSASSTCNSCIDNFINEEELTECVYGGRWMEAGDYYLSPYNEAHCAHHWNMFWTECASCGEVIANDETYDNMCHTCFLDEGGCDCEECMPSLSARQRGVVRAWDYRPELNFHPPTPTNPKKPLYIGVELETSFAGRSWRDGLSTWYRHEVDEDLIYIKSDSSVENGIEIVTHPFEPRWGLKNFPFEAFDSLIDTYNARESHQSCGTHVHMNKEAFTTAHLWKFMHVHYRLPGFLKILGGREDGTYARFDDTDMTVMRQDMMRIVKEKDKGQDYERYVAVNLRNQHTVELRYPASGTSSFLIKKNIQLALALYEFSDYLTVTDVKDGALDDPGYLVHWIRSNDYPELAEFMQRYIPQERKLKERTN